MQDPDKPGTYVCRVPWVHYPTPQAAPCGGGQSDNPRLRSRPLPSTPTTVPAMTQQRKPMAIKYSRNWNGKLFQHCHTTIRLASKTGHLAVRQDVLIELMNEPLYMARIKNIWHVKYGAIPQAILTLDTGLNKEAADKLFGSFYGKTAGFGLDTLMAVITIERISEPYDYDMWYELFKKTFSEDAYVAWQKRRYPGLFRDV